MAKRKQKLSPVSPVTTPELTYEARCAAVTATEVVVVKGGALAGGHSKGTRLVVLQPRQPEPANGLYVDALAAHQMMNQGIAHDAAATAGEDDG